MRATVQCKEEAVDKREAALYTLPQYSNLPWEYTHENDERPLLYRFLLLLLSQRFVCVWAKIGFYCMALPAKAENKLAACKGG